MIDRNGIVVGIHSQPDQPLIPWIVSRSSLCLAFKVLENFFKITVSFKMIIPQRSSFCSLNPRRPKWIMLFSHTVVNRACSELTALYNNKRTLKFKGRPTNAFFTAVNQMFGGSSQLTTTAEHCFVLWTRHNDLITARSAEVGSWEEPPNIWSTVAKNEFVGWALNFRHVIAKRSIPSNFFSNRIWYSCYWSWACCQRSLWPFPLVFMSNRW